MPITIPAQPFTFASESGNQPAAQLDSSFANIRSALTGIALQASDLIGSYGVRGLIGAKNAGTPLTKYDLSADLVVLRNPSGGLNIQTATGTLTNDVGLAGSAAGGRDQAGAFTASSWIHFYFIWSGTTLSTLSSATAPPTGPALPTGYTHWAYAGAVRFDGSSHLIATTMRGAWMEYEAPAIVLNAGNATVETAVSLATSIPPNAVRFILNGAGNHMGATRGAGGIDISLALRYVSGANYWVNRLFDNVTTLSGTTVLNPLSDLSFPNLSQQFFYQFAVTQGSAPTFSAQVSSYSVPNGGE